MHQLSALPLQPLSLNPPPPLSASLQGRGRPLLLISFAHTHATLILALCLRQGVPPLLPTIVPAPLAQISASPLWQGGPSLQPSAVNTPSQISSLLIQQDVLHLNTSAVRDAPPLISFYLQGLGRPPPPPSDVHAHDPLLSVLLHQRVKPSLHPSAVNPPPFPQILAFPLQRDVLPLQTPAAQAPPPPLSVLLQGRDEPPLLPSTVRAYVPILSSLLIWQGVPICHHSEDPDTLPLISALLP